MGSNTDNVVGAVKNINDQLRINIDNQCVATCKQGNFNQTVVLSNTDISGSVGFNQQCSANAYCSFDANLYNAASMISKDLGNINQTMSNPSFWSYELSDAENGTNLEENIQNSLSVSSTNLCFANNTQLQSKNIVYLNNSNISGDVVFSSQSGSAEAACAMNNLSKYIALTCNQTQVDIKQSASTGFIIGIVIIAISLIIMLLLGFIVMTKTGSGDDKSKLTPEEKAENIETQQELISQEFAQPRSVTF